MSYEIRFTGEIQIHPHLSADEILSAGFCEPGLFGKKDIAVKVEELPVASHPGAFRRWVTAIVPITSRYSAHNAVADAQDIVSRWGADSRFTGYLQGVGEEADDIFRIQMQRREIVEVRPRIVWPDDSEGV